MKKKLLICGCTGFIGRNLVEYFSKKDEYQVYGTFFNSPPPSIENVTFLKADLTTKQDVDMVIKNMDIVVQAAATTSGAKDIINKPYFHVTDNAVMNSLILRSIFENGVKRFIFFSCTVMYQSSDIPLLESDFDASKEIYKNYFGVGWTKVYIEKMCEFYSRISDTKVTVIRHSNIYGPHDKFDLEKSHVFGATLTKVMTNNDGKLIVWGTGETARDLLYISDLVTSVDLAISRQKNNFEVFNIGNGRAVTVKELVETIIKKSEKDIKIEFDETKPDLKTKLSLNCTKANTLLGWSCIVSLDEGIDKTMTWWKNNIKIT